MTTDGRVFYYNDGVGNGMEADPEFTQTIQDGLENAGINTSDLKAYASDSESKWHYGFIVMYDKNGIKNGLPSNIRYKPMSQREFRDAKVYDWYRNNDLSAEDLS